MVFCVLYNAVRFLVQYILHCTIVCGLFSVICNVVYLRL